MNIFISGPSGCGKSTFCKHYSKIYNIPYKSGIREVLQSLDENASFKDRQDLLIDYYINLIKVNKIISDRSILDIISWTNKLLPEYTLSRLDNITFSNTLLIVAPTPTIRFYTDNIKLISNDKYRFKAYDELLSISTLSMIESCERIRKLSEQIEVEMKEYILKRKLKHIFPKQTDADDYFSWQIDLIKTLEDF